MLSFANFCKLNEEKINYNHTNQHWQVRGDDDKHTFKHEQEKVIIKNAAPYVDHDAHEAGKRVYAYMQGSVQRNEPDLSNHTAHPIHFQRDNVEHPFVHTHDGSPVRHADYVVFHKNKATAYYKN